MSYGDNPAKILFDASGNPVLITSDGNTYSLATKDIEQIELLKEVRDKLTTLCELIEEMNE